VIESAKVDRMEHNSPRYELFYTALPKQLSESKSRSQG
jgi:hypothetical protein